MNIPTQSRFSLSLVVSVAVHIVLVAVVFWQLQQLPPAPVHSNDKQAISIGLQAALAGAATSKAKQAQNQTKEVQARIEPEEKPEPVKKTPPIETPKAIAKAAPKPKVVEPKETPPKKVAKKEPEPKREKKEQPQKVSKATIAQAQSIDSNAGAQGVNGSTQNTQQQTETGVANQTAASANEQYDYLVRQHLLAKKMAPNLLSSSRVRGEVTLVFTLDRQGKVLKAEIANASRIRAFNKAAVKMLAKASPFPAAPMNVDWQQREFNVVVTYDIH